jgi:hypothetical protein|tara:strand:- start:1538 stop:2089 length:552 start_codon:yes stop_codon:yes gene_type:complete
MSNFRQILYGLAEFILDNKTNVIIYLNNNGYAAIPLSTPVDEVNKIIALNMLNEDFVHDFLLFQRATEEGKYSEFIIAVATAVAMIGTAISNGINAAKTRIFNEGILRRNEQYQKEWGLWEQEQAELRAAKEIAIELGRAQTDIILTRDMAEEKVTTNNNLLLFGVCIVGAIALAYILKKEKK